MRSFFRSKIVAIFDEAQRAWKGDELQCFMRENRGIMEFPYIETRIPHQL